MRSRFALLALWLSVGCRQLLGLDDKPIEQLDAAVTDARHDATPGDGPAGYHASAVRFDGSDYLTALGLANTTDSPRGTFSVWLHFNAGDGQQQLISVAQIVGIGGVLRTSANKIELLMQQCTSPVVVDIQTQSAYTTASGWIHVLASWDASAGRALLYINDIADFASNPTINNGNICYSTPKWGMGGLSSGQLTADVADLYAALGTFVDIDVLAKRRLFSTAAGKPVDLGANCMTPTAAIPTACFTGDAAAWAINKGNGGGFTTNGDGLSPAPTSPSD